MIEYIIVGSGPAGVAAALALQNSDVLVLDVGYDRNPAENFNENLYDLKRKRSLFKELVGENFEGMHNISNKYLSPKLKPPLMRYITKGESNHLHIVSETFDSKLSFAKGGLANAWGAGVLRFDEKDIDSWPIKAFDLDPYYDLLTSHIGINGTKDDLTPYYGKVEGLQSPHNLSFAGKELLDRYSNKKEFFNKNGIFIGRARSAILTEMKGGREPIQYDHLEFYRSHIQSIYTPAYTLNDLIRKKLIKYLPNKLVLSYSELTDRIEVVCKNLLENSIEKFYCKKLILASGCLSTTKIVLDSNNDCDSKLPILDNAISYVPFVIPKFIGKGLEKRGTSIQLMIVIDLPNKPRLQASFYGLGGTMKSDLFMDFPLSIRGNIAASKYLIPAMAITQVFYPDFPRSENFISLRKNKDLYIHYNKANYTKGEIENFLIKKFRKINFFSHSSLCKYPSPGNSFHYAGTLPMSENPQKYQTSNNGLLFGSKNVYIVDGSNFPNLPAKNHTFTIMANSMRIASRLRGKSI